MNNEIKEILDRIETASEIFDCLLKPKECTELLDYITNLQQENEETKEVNENLLRYVSELILYIDDYKSRCEKAIEYIENPGHEMSVLTYQNLLNILQNGSDEE